MQEKIETILKEIYITFSKSTVCKEAPDEIIVNKRILFELLEQLNETVYEMMERYEVTVQGKDRAEREMKRKGDSIILDATQKAEDVYAASVLYTEDALGKLEKMMDQTKQRFEEMCNIFVFSMDGEKNLIKENKIELAGQLNQLIESKKYLKIIEDQNKADEKMQKHTVKENCKNKISAVPYNKKINNANLSSVNKSSIDESFVGKGLNDGSYDNTSLINIDLTDIDLDLTDIDLTDIDLTDIDLTDISKTDIRKIDIGERDTNKRDMSKRDMSKRDTSKRDSCQMGMSSIDASYADIGDEEIGMNRIPQAIIQVDLDAEYFKWKNKEEVEIKSTPKKSRKSFFGKR